MLLKPEYRLLVMLLAALGNFTCFAQQPVSRYEFRWAVFHPFAALKVKKQLPKALAIYTAMKKSGLPDAYNSGGKLDAFRHVYTMAFLARHIKPRKLRKLGKAHEKGNKRQFMKGKQEEGERPDSLACDMDLRNNELGFAIGLANRTAGDTLLKDMVLQAISDGKAWYLKRNARSEYVDCAGKPLDPSLYRKNWYVPKCLIKTNE
jgi:hypothetical protein